MAYLPEFKVLDTINIELDQLAKKQKSKGLEPMDIALLEKLVLTKVKILTELSPKDRDQVQRLGAEVELMLLESSLESLGLSDDVKYITLPEGKQIGTNKKPKKPKKGS